MDCTELSKLIAEMAMDLASDPGVKTLDDVVEKMHAFESLKGITREDVANAIDEATADHASTLSDIERQVAAIRREAWRDADLRRAINELQQSMKAGKPALTKPAPKKSTPTEAIRKLQEEKDRLESLVEASTMPSSLSRLAQQMAKKLVESGLSDRNALVDEVHKMLLESFPDLSRRQVMDAISGYGEYHELSKEDAAVRLRDLKGQLQQVAKLEDMAGGKAPAKTGAERRSPSDEERRLVKEVNEAKKKGGYAITDPAKQLRTTLDSIKTRLKNQIADLQDQIDTRTKTRKETTPAPSDTEADSLRAERDELKKQFNEIFGKPEMSDDQRLAMSRRATEKQIADLEKRLADGDFSAKAKRPPVSSGELVELRNRRDAIRKEYDRKNPDPPDLRRAKSRLAELEKHLADGTLPAPSERESDPPTDQAREVRAKLAAVRKALANSAPSLRKRFEKQIADLEARLAAGDFAPPVRREELPLGKELDELRYRRDRLRDEIHQKIGGLRPRTVWDRVAEPFNAARAIMTSMDVSAVLRQGGFIALGRPARVASSLPAMFKAFGSDKFAHATMDKILDRVNAPLYRRSKLYLSPLEADGNLSSKEEAFMSRWAEKIPGVKASARAYVVFLNKLRADSFDAMVESMGRSGAVTQKEAEAIANYINVATGRGNLGSMESAAVPMAQVLFSPRLVASRFQLLALQPLYHGSARTRKAIAGEYARFILGAGIVLALGAAAGGDLEDDPRSSDFGKIRFGKTRLDPMGGLIQPFVLMSRLVSGKTKSGKGAVIPIRGEGRPHDGKAAWDIIAAFVRSKLSPIASTAVDVISKENTVGENTDITTAEGARRVGGNLFMPMVVRDIYEAIESQGVPKGVALGLLSLFGAGLQTYDSVPGDEREIKKAQSEIYRAEEMKRIKTRALSNELKDLKLPAYTDELKKLRAKADPTEYERVRMESLGKIESKFQSYAKSRADGKPEPEGDVRDAVEHHQKQWAAGGPAHERVEFMEKHGEALRRLQERSSELSKAESRIKDIPQAGRAAFIKAHPILREKQEIERRMDAIRDIRKAIESNEKAGKPSEAQYRAMSKAIGP